MSEVSLLSQLLNAELDAIGLNKDMVRRRVKMYKKRSAAKAAATKKILRCDHIEKVIVGSRREGVATETSDTDVLQINHRIFCSTDVADFDDKEDKACLLLECDDAPPGYAFLTLHSPDVEVRSKYFDEIEQAVISRYNKLYLSSEKYMSLMEQQQTTSQRGWFGKNVRRKERKGPAIPKVLDSLGFETDLVSAFSASCPNILNAWENKDRPFDWPSKSVVKCVAKQHAYVVAVGEHGTEQEDIQWRISFNDAEMVLVGSLNDTQIKLLVIMKLLAKYLISPVCSDITSYVVKNAVFHLAEQNPLKDFEHSTLIERSIDCLKFLRNCVEKRNLPNYMNPERNLFHGKLLTENEMTSTMNVIDDILENGKDILMFYIVNKMKPENIRNTYPLLAELKRSLERGKADDILAQKKVNAMSQEQLVNLHIHTNDSQFELMVFINELYYVYRPYVSKYGFRSLFEDLGKFRPRTKTQTETRGKEGETFAGGVPADQNQHENELNTSEESHPDKSDPSEESSALENDVESPDNGDADPVHNDREHEHAGHFYKLIAVIWSALLWTCALVFKLMLLNMFQVIHMACLIWMWYSLRLNSNTEMTYLIDVVGITLVVISGGSFIKKPFSEILNVFHVTLLVAIWRKYMSFSDPYTMYFQELIVMLDPQQADANYYRKTVLDTDDFGYRDMKHTYYT